MARLKAALHSVYADPGIDEISADAAALAARFGFEGGGDAS